MLWLLQGIERPKGNAKKRNGEGNFGPNPLTFLPPRSDGPDK